MRVYELFFEATKSAKELIGYRGSLEWIKQNIPPDQYSQYGVTLTMIDKIGVNPRSSYATPIGVYFYPLDFYVSETSAGRTMPFPEFPKYIKIFRINAEAGSYLDLDQLSEADFKEFVDRIKDLFYEFVSSFPKNSGYLSLDRDETDSMINDLEDDSVGEARVQNPAGRFWYVLWQLSSSIMNGPGLKKSQRNALIQAQRSSVLWNWMFRQLGISAVRDTQGIIHSNERTQGVVFDPKVIQLARTFQVYNNKRIDVTPPEQHPAGISGHLADNILKFTSMIYDYETSIITPDQKERLIRYQSYLTNFMRRLPSNQLLIKDMSVIKEFHDMIRDYLSTPELMKLIQQLTINSYQNEYQNLRTQLEQAIEQVQQNLPDIQKKPNLLEELKNKLNDLVNQEPYENYDPYNSFPYQAVIDRDFDVLTAKAKSLLNIAKNQKQFTSSGNQ